MTDRPEPHDTFDFPKTRWDLVIAARDSEGARNQLLTLYNRPILAYFRALTRHGATAEELRQSFFVAELTRLSGDGEGGVVRRADPRKGRFRDYLKQSLRRHWLSWLRRKQSDPLPVPDDTDSRHPRVEDAERAVEEAERAFVGAWVRQMIVVALRSVERTCQERGQEQHFTIFTAYYFPNNAEDHPSWEALAERTFLKNGQQARNRAATVQAHFHRAFGELLLQERPGGVLLNEVRDVLSILGEEHD